MPFPIITISLAAITFYFFQNAYILMIAYMFLAVNMTIFLLNKNVYLGVFSFLSFCLLAPFSLAYKIFLFGMILCIANSGTHGRISHHVETVAGITLIVGIVMGVYNFFAQ